jgi:deoxyribose-phosphate aldolase
MSLRTCYSWLAWDTAQYHLLVSANVHPVTPARLLEEKRSLAAVIDHTLLRPEATSADVQKLCEEALSHGFASVCINPSWVPVAREWTMGSEVKVCTVVGFPLGANETRTKVHETVFARERGAAEIDMVINIGALRSGEYRFVETEIREIAQVARTHDGLLKVIIETCLLSEQEKTTACRLAVNGGADFVKTSTGFSKGGATVDDVRLMRQLVGSSVGVKASGGIRTLSGVRDMLAAGATRIGASASVAIMQELEGEVAPSPASGY